MDAARRPILQGEYKLVKILERFDYSTLFLATALHNEERKFAIKQVPLDTFHSDEEKKETLNYFRNRAFPYVELMHPGITTLKDFFYENGCEYIVFEYVAGHRLTEVMELRNRPFTEPQAVDLALRIAEILEWMHSLTPALYFADLNPHNVILMPRGRVRLTDFGLGKMLAPRDPDEPRLGTKGYAPPEQFGPEAKVGRANDVYALGVLMHQLVTGHDPTERPGVFANIGDVNPAISEDYQVIVARATQADANLRYQDVRELVADLKALAPARRGAADAKPSFLERVRQVLRRPFVAA